ncbi:hypothetical protein CC1G_06913 [Coprinopsis cinerea okayama7|uniref:Uncharacterized protein n=1 Tax=Coprinopsis cinerea (strain Okayama-7 / 130 / ATCC MYA-4618 / FGSC 9003) TaxID=240176 RepID=A8NZN0_COPC7|nr:hypothetical protein CC1G_06913 [Coprinopsis cinerea okayama7\|eukprot:XP_001837707.1 hypothetical protein CC1G_06913 [Coprinopsis cinerea okayama7\
MSSLTATDFIRPYVYVPMHTSTKQRGRKRRRLETPGRSLDDDSEHTDSSSSPFPSRDESPSTVNGNDDRRRTRSQSRMVLTSTQSIPKLRPSSRLGFKAAKRRSSVPRGMDKDNSKDTTTLVPAKRAREDSCERRPSSSRVSEPRSEQTDAEPESSTPAQALRRSTRSRPLASKNLALSPSSSRATSSTPSRRTSPSPFPSPKSKPPTSTSLGQSEPSSVPKPPKQRNDKPEATNVKKRFTRSSLKEEPGPALLSQAPARFKSILGTSSSIQIPWKPLHPATIRNIELRREFLQSKAKEVVPQLPQGQPTIIVSTFRLAAENKDLLRTNLFKDIDNRGSK